MHGVMKHFLRPVVAFAVIAFAVGALFVACGPAEEPRLDDEPAPTLADFAGTWQAAITVPAADDPIPATITGTADPGEWTLDLEGRSGIPLEASVVGDSLITRSAEYESILRPGVMVTVRTAGVLQDGMLMGDVVATYQTEDGEEVVRGTIHATRAP